MGGLLDTVFLQRRINDGCTEKEDQRASTRILIAPQPQSLDRHFRITPRHYRGCGIVRVVQSVWVESLRPSEIEEFWASIV